MPKIKTHKASKKRFRLTATGKVKCKQTGTRHLNVSMSKKRRRNLRGTDTIDPCEYAKVTTLLNGYGY
jgi:large subunit ribosomal protein L35